MPKSNWRTCRAVCGKRHRTAGIRLTFRGVVSRQQGFEVGVLAEGGEVGVLLEVLEIVVAGGEGGFQGGQGEGGETLALGPLLGAGLTGEWRYLPAGVALGVAGLLAGAGGAIVQSTVVPIAVPESDNPLAGGDTGSGLLAALVLVAVLITLAVITLPAALALIWALTTDSVAIVTALALLTPLGGWVVMRLAERAAAQRWPRREPEIYDPIIPARWRGCWRGWTGPPPKARLRSSAWPPTPRFFRVIWWRA